MSRPHHWALTFSGRCRDVGEGRPDGHGAPNVSVVMNCLNGAEYLREAMDSVFAQTFQDWEIVFVDNASTDKSLAIAHSYGDRVTCLTSLKTVPLGKARNVALEASRGGYLAFLDCDDIWAPEKLERQLPLFEKSSVGLVFSDVICFNRTGYARPKYGHASPPQGRVFDRMVVFDNFVCFSTAVVRSKIVKEQDIWFDPTLTVIEDTDFFARLCRDWEVAYAPHPLCRYRMHEKSWSYLASQHFFDEQEQVMDKYSRLFPEFEQRYAAGIRIRMARDRAVLEWKKGNQWQARRILKSILFKRRRHCLDYCAMLLPYSVLHRLRVLFSSRAFTNYE